MSANGEDYLSNVTVFETSAIKYRRYKSQSKLYFTI